MFKNCEFKVLSRCSGKTTCLVNDFKSQPRESSLFVGFDRNTLNMSFPKSEDKDAQVNVLASKDFETNFWYVGRKNHFKNMYIDDYLFYGEGVQGLVYEFAKRYVTDTVFIRTTSPKFHDKNTINLIKDIKKVERIYGFSLIPNTPIFNYDYYYNNFMTEQETTLQVRYDDAKIFLTKELFDLQFNGKLFKE